MSAVTAEGVRWEELDNEWAHIDALYRGEKSPGRVVNWGNANGYANISVVIEDPERGYIRVANAPTPEVGK